MKLLNPLNIILLLVVGGIIILAWILLWQFVYLSSEDGFVAAVNSILSFVQILAIIFGAWVAYKKLIYEKRIDEAIKVKAALLKYESKRNYEAAGYRSHGDIARFRVNILNEYNELIENLQLSVLPRKLRENISETIFIDIAADESKIDEEWSKFGEKLKKVYVELDDIILY